MVYSKEVISLLSNLISSPTPLIEDPKSVKKVLMLQLGFSFEGHLDRLARVAFHPSGKHLGTIIFDKTWRLWDINTGAELLLQEGHSRSVYGIASQQNGALAASSGIDSLARVWDLHTGRSILVFQGHIKPIWSDKDFLLVKSLAGHESKVASLDIAADSSCTATVSHDRTIKLWTSNINEEEDKDNETMDIYH